MWTIIFTLCFNYFTPENWQTRFRARLQKKRGRLFVSKTSRQGVEPASLVQWEHKVFCTDKNGRGLKLITYFKTGRRKNGEVLSQLPLYCFEACTRIFKHSGYILPPSCLFYCRFSQYLHVGSCYIRKLENSKKDEVEMTVQGRKDLELIRYLQ